jgi:hypothetical protein
MITFYPHTSAQSDGFTSRCSVAAFNGGRSPQSGFANCPRASASNSNGSQELNRSNHLTHSLSINSTNCPLTSRRRRKHPSVSLLVLPSLLYAIVGVETYFIAEPLLSNGCVYLLIPRPLPSIGSACPGMVSPQPSLHHGTVL